MSDTPVVPNTQQVAEEDIPSYLASTVKVDPSLARTYRSGTAMTEADAVKLWRSKASWGEQITPGRGANVLTRPGDYDVYAWIYQAIPAEQRTAELLSSIDIRPYLAALDQLSYTKTDIITHEQYQVAPDFAAPLAQLNETITTFYASQLPTTLTPGERQAMLDEAAAFTPGVAGINPINNEAALQSASEGATGFDATKVGDTSSLFPVEEMRAMVQAATMNVDQVAGAEADAGGGSQFPIDVTGERRNPYAKPSAFMGAGQASSYLYTLTKKELVTMQKKLAAAGYFDRVGAGTYIEGEVTDSNTLAAWKLALTDAITKNKSLPSLVAEGMDSYRESVRAARLKDLQQMDPTYAANLGSDYAMTVIGRGLTGDEQDQLRKYLQTLVSGRAGFVGAADNTGVDGPLTSAVGYTEADVQGFVNKEHSADQFMQISADRWGND